MRESPLASNFLAGAAGSAAEQYISEGKVDARKSITSGLTNAVSNAIYGTQPLKNVGDAFLHGAGAGAATAGINYISDLIGQNPGWGGPDAGFLTGMAGKLVSPYGEVVRDPRRGCGSTSPFVTVPGYGSSKGYQYDVPRAGGAGRKQRKKFSLKEFLRETAVGGITGGVASAGFYGAGKGIERLKDGFRAGKSISSSGFYQDARGRWHRPNGQFASNAEVGISSPVKFRTSSHGNSLSDPRTNYGYALLDRDTNEILKFGETIHPTKRYSQKYLNTYNAKMVIMEQGNKLDIHFWQHDMNEYYFYKYNEYPHLNRNGW